MLQAIDRSTNAAPMSALLSPTQRRVALAFAEALIPGSQNIPAADERTVQQVESYLYAQGEWVVKAWAVLQQGLDWLALTYGGRPFHALSTRQQQSLLNRWVNNPAIAPSLSFLRVLYKLVHFDTDSVYRHLGGNREPIVACGTEYREDGIITAEQWPKDETIECDVVVVGTGAGGAVIGRELAEKGYAVAFIEEGPNLKRHEFCRSIIKSTQRYYRSQLLAVGNTVIPVLAGKLVGGSTAVNTGTCLRPPNRVLEKWCEKLGSDAFSPQNMRGYFERVEQHLQVAPSDRKAIGPFADVIARGCDKLGWSHYAIPRNAPGCNGEGFCLYGCTADARRSTNVSYIPSALRRGALVVSAARVSTITIERGRAVGVQARCVNTDKRIDVRASAVVLACGAIPTPLLLMKQGICNRSGELGRNLTIHPSTCVSGLFDEDINGHGHVPQGYGSQQFLDQGILLSGALTDLSILANTVALHGKQLIQTVEMHSHLASLGILAEDQGKGGRIWNEIGGRTIMTYYLNKQDIALLHRGMSYTVDIFRAAGARKIYPLLSSFPVLASGNDLKRFRAFSPSPRDFVLTSFHPLGTCKMGTRPTNSVVGLDHNAHDLPGLYIVDGSTVPGPTSVNPQIAIMAMATRAADRIAERLG